MYTGWFVCGPQGFGKQINNGIKWKKIKAF
jgi:hypothetical protein